MDVKISFSLLVDLECSRVSGVFCRTGGHQWGTYETFEIPLVKPNRKTQMTTDPSTCLCLLGRDCEI